MIKTKIISSLEKVFIDESINAYPQLKRMSALRGERINFQIAYTYDTKGSPMPYVAPKYKPQLSGELAKYANLRQVMYVPVNFPTHVLGFDDNYLRTAPGLFPDVLRPLYYGGTMTFAKDALNAKFGSATIVRGSSIQSKLDVGKKYRAQIELKKDETVRSTEGGSADGKE